MAVYKLKRKLFTKWDETDKLKTMKDSDILAEKKRSQNVGSNLLDTGLAAGKTAIGGAAIGAGIGMGTGFLKNASNFNVSGKGFLGGASSIGTGMKGMGKSALKLGKYGAIVGGVIGVGKTVGKQMKKANENNFYNDRLEYAQNQARRREKRDWKQNMTQRDGYTY